MALPALDLFPAIVAALFSAHPGTLDRLAVRYASARLGVPLQANSHSLAQGGVHLLPCPVQAPGAEVMVDGLPGWEVVGQQPPGAAAADDVEDGVKDLAGGVRIGTSGSFGG